MQLQKPPIHIFQTSLKPKFINSQNNLTSLTYIFTHQNDSEISFKYTDYKIIASSLIIHFAKLQNFRLNIFKFKYFL